MMDDAIRGASEQDLFNPAVAVRCQDDQICVPDRSLIQDLLVGTSRPDRRRGRDRVANFIRDEQLQFIRGLLAQFVLHTRKHDLSETEIGRIDRRLDDVYQVQLGMEFLGERNRVRQCVA
jgi:hypothetical protein